ncbi:MAG: mannose-6-phosphate isomerase, class I [Lentisphaerae bacterium]|jgi:mannose-6-phosphate isomerase|nr:mannose-6-phosphate isomerase, class I [Lentisphaerota bacterium]
MDGFGRFYRLHCHVRHYPWGCRAHGERQPYIADLLGESAAPGQPWAELWLGAHPSLSAEVVTESGEENLATFIDAHQEEILGATTLAAGFQTLPFLLKVLSCERPLSIQSHPDKQNAVRLHALRPEKYPDDNHKPELLIALTDFRALAGFRELDAVLPQLSRLKSLAPWSAVWQEASELTLRVLCETLLLFPGSLMRPMLRALRRELSLLSDVTFEDRLCLDLLDSAPADRGVLFAYILNRVKLRPGEAMFIPPGEPHAYLRGTGMECMANSDNVIRVGLTPKPIDVPALVSTVKFTARAVQPDCGEEMAPGQQLYRTPAQEFQALMLRDASLDIAQRPVVPGVFLVLSGAVELSAPGMTPCVAKRGSSWLRPAALTAGSLRPLESNTCVVWAEGVVSDQAEERT